MEYPVERIERLERYIREGFPTIWSQSVPDAMLLTQRYDRTLYLHDVDGGVAEIGVLRGAFIIGLHQLMPDDAYSLAIDCFDIPDYDLELPGDRAILKDYTDNVKRCAHNPEAARWIEANSGTISPTKMADEIGRVFKFFSIDGLHTEDRTLHDLHLAAAMLVDGGMIILDDWKYGCPEVVNAGERFTDEGNFSPVSYGFNKMWFAHNRFVDRYQSIRLYPKVEMIDVYGRSIPQLGPSDPYNPGTWFC